MSQRKKPQQAERKLFFKRSTAVLGGVSVVVGLLSGVIAIDEKINEMIFSDQVSVDPLYRGPGLETLLDFVADQDSKVYLQLRNSESLDHLNYYVDFKDSNDRQERDHAFQALLFAIQKEEQQQAPSHTLSHLYAAKGAFLFSEERFDQAAEAVDKATDLDPSNSYAAHLFVLLSKRQEAAKGKKDGKKKAATALSQCGATCQDSSDRPSP